MEHSLSPSVYWRWAVMQCVIWSPGKGRLSMKNIPGCFYHLAAGAVNDQWLLLCRPGLLWPCQPGLLVAPRRWDGRPLSNSPCGSAICNPSRQSAPLKLCSIISIKRVANESPRCRKWMLNAQKCRISQRYWWTDYAARGLRVLMPLFTFSCSLT